MVLDTTSGQEMMYLLPEALAQMALLRALFYIEKRMKNAEIT